MTSITRQNLSATTKILTLVFEVIYDTSPKQGQLLVEAAACFNNKTTFCLQIKCLSTTLTLDLEEESSCVGQNAEA